VGVTLIWGVNGLGLVTFGLVLFNVKEGSTINSPPTLKLYLLLTGRGRVVEGVLVFALLPILIELPEVPEPKL
jgi:hypothetical protein